MYPNSIEKPTKCDHPVAGQLSSQKVVSRRGSGLAAGYDHQNAGRRAAQVCLIVHKGTLGRRAAAEDDDDTLINARVAAPRPPPRRRPRKIRFTLPAIEQSRLNKKAVSSSRCFSVWIGTRCNHLLYTTSLDRVNLIDLTPLFKYSKAYGFALIRTEGEIKVCRWLREFSSCSCLTVLPGPA